VDVFASCSQLTNTELCPIANDDIRLIYLQEPVGTNMNNYRLQASNPGQFYYNVFYTGGVGGLPLTIDIPYPFVTNGANPIQIHNTTPPEISETPTTGVTNPGDPACWDFGTPWTGCTITTDAGKTSVSGHPVILLSDYSPQNIGDTQQVMVACDTVPPQGVYVSIHLDYGLKGTSGWADLTPAETTISNVINSALGVEIDDGEEYQFDFSDINVVPVDWHAVSSFNQLKKNPGVAGMTLQTGTVTPVSGVQVKLKNSSNTVVGTAASHVDGFYQINYKHTGKAANFTVTVTLGVFSTSQTIQLKANGFVAVVFNNLP
jgi:hypothetical protein